MRRHARDARDRSDLIERGHDINIRLSCPRVRAIALCATKGVSSRHRVVHRTIDLGERRARFLQITNIPIWNRPKKSADI